MPSDSYRQCILRKGNRETHSWVPKSIAKKRNCVRIKRPGKDWEGGWVIYEVCFAWILREDEVKVAMDEYRHHRKRTDV